MLEPMWRSWAPLLLLLMGCNSPYYQPCQGERTCPSTWTCYRLGISEQAFCTMRCSTNEHCEEQLGSGSYCSNGEHCLTACTSDIDCPPPARCDIASHVCVIADGGM